VLVERPDETGFHGLGTGRGVGDVPGRKPTVSNMLEGYYDIVRRAVLLAILGRLGVSTVVAALLWRRYRASKTKAVFVAP
jgi:hypothetical protein